MTDKMAAWNEFPSARSF